MHHRLLPNHEEPQHAEAKHLPHLTILVAVVTLNVGITLIEYVTGFATKSLLLIADATHNLTDAVTLIISLVALLIARRQSNTKKTYGYKRTEILAAFLNAIFLVVITVFLVIESIERLVNVEESPPLVVIILGAAALFINTLSALLLKRGASDNSNMKSSYLHMLSDAMVSIAVIVGALAIYFFHFYPIEAILSILISLYIVWQCYGILATTMHILLQGSPPSLNLKDIKRAIETIPEVDNVHHLHLWQMNDNDYYFEGHIQIKDNVEMGQVDHYRIRIEELLNTSFDIHHTTIQFEYHCCPDSRNEMIHQH